MSLELLLFGAPRITLDGAPVRFDTRKATALLAVLSVSGRRLRRDALAALLWPELDRSRSRAALRRTLSVAAVVGPALTVDGDLIGLDLARVQCDVIEFRALAQRDDVASWTAAVTLAEADLLEGFSLRDSVAFDDWQREAAEGLRNELARVLARLTAYHLDREQLADALEVARRHVSVDRLSEPAHAALMRILALAGDRSGALQVYRSLVRLLDVELGVPPLPQTVSLSEAIRADRLEGLRSSRAGTPIADHGAAPPADRRGAGAAAGADRLVGRDRELAAIEQHRSLLHERGTVIGLVGEPGMGKTAVIERVARRATEEGHPVVSVAGHAVEQSLAYAAAHDLVRRMLEVRPALIDELGHSGAALALLADLGGRADAAQPEGIGGPGDLQRVHEAVRAALELIAAKRTAVLVIDDAHRLDRPSSALLAYVLRRPPRGLLILVAWPPGGAAAVLPTTVGADGRVLTLRPLDAEEVRELVLMLGGEVDSLDEVRQRTRGVPLLVREFATIGAEGGDASRDLVAARFESAPEITRQLVVAAAIIGTVAEPDLLRLVAGRDEIETVDALDDAAARGLLVERRDRPGYDLPHELVRSAALGRLSLARSRLLHGRAAELLERRSASDDRGVSAGAIAQHWALAGNDAAAARWFEVAAEQAARLGAHLECLEHLRAAMALGARSSELHEAAGLALVRLGRYDDALLSYEQAAAASHGDARRLAAIEHAIAGVHDRLGDAVLARSHLAAARELLAELADDPALARSVRIEADLALVLHRLGDGMSAEATALAAQRRAVALRDAAALVQVRNVLGVVALARGDSHAALGFLEQAVDLARELREHDLPIATLNNLARARHAAGDGAGALDLAREAVQRAEQQGDRHRLAVLHSNLADLLHAAGRDDEAMVELKSSAAAFADVHDAALRPEVWTLTEW